MSSWVVQIEEKLSSLEPLPTIQRWRMCKIPDSEGYKCPDFKEVYKPYIVNMTDFDYYPEEWRLRVDSQQQFLRRSGMPLESYLTALGEVGNDLIHAYWLPPEWLEDDDFLKKMLLNGCFLLEFVYTINDIKSGSADDDTVNHTIKRILENPEEMRRYVHDILLLENQVPLIVLEKLHCLWTGDDRTKFLKVITATFMPKNGGPEIERMPSELEGSLHILDVYRRVLVHSDFKKVKPPREKNKQVKFVSTIIPAATKLHNIGIGFAISDSTSLLDISFQRDTLKLPKIVVDDSIKSIFLNLIAFEKLHKNINIKVVNEYMYLMGCLIQTADDVSLLQSYNIIVTTLPPHEVNILFRRMSKVISPSHLCLDPKYTMMLRMVGLRSEKLSNEWQKVFQTYLKSPWAIMSATLLFTLSIIQTVYTVLSYYVRPK